MQRVSQVIETVLALFRTGLDWTLGLLVAAEQWLGTQLTAAGVPHDIQAPIMVAVAIVLLLLVLRIFGGVIRVLLVIFLILLALHAVMPLVHA